MHACLCRHRVLHKRSLSPKYTRFMLTSWYDQYLGLIHFRFFQHKRKLALLRIAIISLKDNFLYLVHHDIVSRWMLNEKCDEWLFINGKQYSRTTVHWIAHSAFCGVRSRFLWFGKFFILSFFVVHYIVSFTRRKQQQQSLHHNYYKSANDRTNHQRSYVNIDCAVLSAASE